jgi:L-alanine-DL-glutamate epimerase-like enolase superfamily enzyme
MVVRAVHTAVLEQTATSITAPRFAISSVHNAGVRLTDEGGRTGFGYAYTFDAGSAEAVRLLIAELGTAYEGREVDELRAVRSRLLTTSGNFLGVRGLARLALAALDMAAWDLLCKTRGTTLAGLLGRERSGQPGYAAYGLWAGLPPEACAATALAVAEDFGLRHAKMWVGSADLAFEVDRVTAVREALGPDAAVIVDAAQAYDWRTALTLATLLEPLGIEWFEDAVEYDDLEGMRAFGAASPVPAGTGEHVYGLDNLKQLLDLGVVAVVVLDLERIGGITDFLAAAALCEAHRVQLGTHVFPHVSVEALVTARTGTWCEYSPLWDGVLGRPRIEDGELRPRNGPGLGLDLLQGSVWR